MFGDSIVICVFLGKAERERKPTGYHYKRVTVRYHAEQLQKNYMYLKGGNFK